MDDELVMDLLKLVFESKKDSIFLTLDMKDTGVGNKVIESLAFILQECEFKVKITLDVNKLILLVDLN